MKYLKLLLVTLLQLTALHAQNTEEYTISGKLTNSNGQALSNANIYLQGESYGTYSDEKGLYSLSNIKTGNYVLVVSEIGYQTYIEEIEVKGDLQLNVELQEEVNSLGDVVISGNGRSKYTERQPSASLKLQQDIHKIPQNIQVISGDLLQDQQVISMMENVTRNVSGAQMIEHWGNFARVNMRGFRLPPFRNGMNVLSTWGPLAEDMAIVDRVEVVKGPSAFMLSSGEPGGLYNVVTKKPTGNAGGEVGVTTGSYNTLRATLDIEGKLSKDQKLQYRFVGAGTTKGSHRENEFNDRYTFAPTLTYQIDDKTSVTGQYIYQYAKMPLLGSAYVFGPSESGYASLDRDFSLVDPRIDPTIMKEHYGFINFTHQLNDNWNVIAQLSYLNYDQVGSSLWLDGTYGITEEGNLLRRISISDAKEEQKSGQVFVNGTIETGNVSHKIMAGLDFGNKNYIGDWNQPVILDSEENPFNIYDPTPAIHLPDYDRSQSLRKRSSVVLSSEYLSYYAQDELGFFQDKLRLTLAGRLTQFKSSSYGTKTNDEVFTPRIAASYSIIDDLSAYAMFDQSFLPEPGVDRSGNPFEPVEAEDIEGGLKYNFSDGKWNVAAGYFNIIKNNALTSDPEDANFSVQLGEVVSKGFEFDLRGEIAEGLGVILNYANTNVEITEDTNPENIGSRVAGHARHVTNGWFNYKFQQEKVKGLGVSLGYQYLIDRSSWAWGADNRTDLPDYFRMDGALSWENNKFKVALNINNLLNEYLYSGSDYGSYVYWQSEPGRNFRLSLNYKF